jgi:hypothetical protein
MVKELIAIGLIIFWLAYPFAMIIQNSESFVQIDLSSYENIKEPDTINILTTLTFWDYVSIYFKAMYMTIPEAPPYISLLIIILQVITALIIYLLLRGG